MTANQQAVRGQPDEIKGYELTMRESRKTLAGGYLSFEKLHEYGAAIADDPATCVAKLERLRDRLGITEFVLWFNIAGIPGEHAERGMRLAMERVIPPLRGDARAAAE